MKKKIITIIFIIAIAINLKLIYNLIMNHIIIMQYNSGQFLENEAKTLTYVNIQQKYISHYNLGNIYYKNTEFENAVLEYQKALKNIIPKDEECKIRINYALAICKTVQLDENSQDSINSAIEKYKEAINILTEKGCAGDGDNNGHNQNAEQLRYDIQNEINRLENLIKSGTTSEEENNEQQQTDSQDINDIEKKIKDIKENAAKEQRKVENNEKYREGYFEGKRW